MSAGFVNEDQVLIHSLRIDRAFEDEKVLGADQAMLDPWREMKLGSELQHFSGERWLVRPAPQDQAGTFDDFQALVLFFVHFEREISVFSDHEEFFHPGVFVKRNNHPAPFRLDDALTPALDSLKEIRETMGSFPDGIRESDPPTPGRLRDNSR